MNIVELIPVLMFSVLAVFSKRYFRALLFILAAACALFTGYAWFDAYTTNFGLAIGLVFIAYSLLCLTVGVMTLLGKDVI